MRSVAEIARGMGKATTAECFSDDATIELLRAYGIDYVQRFHGGRPAPAENLCWLTGLGRGATGPRNRGEAS